MDSIFICEDSTTKNTGLMDFSGPATFVIFWLWARLAVLQTTFFSYPIFLNFCYFSISIISQFPLFLNFCYFSISVISQFPLFLNFRYFLISVIFQFLLFSWIFLQFLKGLLFPCSNWIQIELSLYGLFCTILKWSLIFIF